MARKPKPESAQAQAGEAVEESAEAEEVAVQEVDGETRETEERSAPTWTKVVLITGSMGTSVGLQDEGCDPVLQLLGGVTLEEALERVPALLEQCRQAWQERPKYEEYQRPPEPERPKPAAVQTGTRPSSASTAKAKQPPAQQSLF